MFGLSIISTEELKRLKDVDTFFSKRIGELTEENFRLKEQVEAFTRSIDRKGRFIKK